MAGVPCISGTESDLKCRACLLKASPTAPNVFEPWNNGNSTIAIDLAKLTGVMILETDPYSKIMCHTCCSKLHNACTFVDMVQDNDRELRALQKETYMGEQWPKPIQLDKNVNDAVFGKVQDVVIKEEVLSEDENFDTSGADDYKPDLNGLEIKTEPEEIVQPTSINITVNGTMSLEDMNAQKSISNDIVVFENEEYLDAPLKEEPMSEDEQPSDLPMDCLLCAKKFMSVSGLKAHVITQHNYKTVRRKTNNSVSPEKKNTAKISCTTCGRNFITLTDLMVHETCHNKTVCYVCGGKFESYSLLMKHRRRCKKSKKAPSKPKCLEDVMTPLPHPLLPTSVTTQTTPPVTLKCLNCNEEFSDLYYLKLHSQIHNSANKEDNKSDQLENDEQINSGNLNIPECDENTELAKDQNANDQPDENNGKDIEIKLQITNIVTLKDQLDYDMLDDSKCNEYQQIKEEATEDFQIGEQLNFEPVKTAECDVNSTHDDYIVKNNGQLTNECDFIEEKCINTCVYDDDKANTYVEHDHNSVHDNEHVEVDHSKTDEDETMVHNMDIDANELAKEMLLKTDA